MPLIKRNFFEKDCYQLFKEYLPLIQFKLKSLSLDMITHRYFYGRALLNIFQEQRAIDEIELTIEYGAFSTLIYKFVKEPIPGIVF